MRRVELAVVVAVLLVFGGSALAGVSFDAVNYEGYVDLAPLRTYQGNSLNDVTYASTGPELFVSFSGAGTGSPVYCIGLPQAGDTVSTPTRTLGDNQYVPRTICSITSQGDDVIAAKYGSDYSNSFTCVEDRVGGNLYTHGGGQGCDNRYQNNWGNGPDGRGAVMNKSSSGGYSPPGWFYGATPISWDKGFQNIVNHGKMDTTHEMRGNYPEPNDHEIGYLEGGKVAYLFVSYDSTESNKKYIEAGEMTWDGAKWVVPGTAEADFAPVDYAADIGTHTLKITLGEQDGIEKLWVLDTSTSKLHVFNFEPARPIPEPAGLGLIGMALMALKRRRTRHG